MHDLAFMAATEWAKARAGNHHDPADFGQHVAQVYWTAKKAFPVESKGPGAADEILRAAGFLPQQPGDSITEASGQRDLGLAARTDQSEGSPIDGDGVECQPLTPELEARMTSEVRGLIDALGQFARSTKLIHEEIPIDAHFGKSIAFLLACCSFQFANTLALSLVRGIFRNGGREYISQLELDIKDLFREIDLDGRRFLAVALADECKGQVLDGARAGDRQ